MNRTCILRGWRSWLCGLVALSLSACMDEELPGSEVGLKEGEISLQWIAANMGQVVTKGTDAKTRAEREIKNVHIFLFGPGGDYLHADNDERDAFQGYRHLEGGRNNWILSTELFANTDREAEDAIVYVLANMPEGTFTDGDNDGKPDVLVDAEKKPMVVLESMTINLPEFTTEIPETGLPMVLKEEHHDLINGKQVITLQLESMMARIDLDFTMDPLVSNGNVPSLEFTNVSVGHFPKGGMVKSQLPTAEETDVEAYGLIEEEEVIGAALVGKVLRDGSQQGMTLYMFEHARKAKSLNEVFENGKYPENIVDSSEMQRYKNSLAADDAAYVKLEGLYTTQSGLVYHVAYTLYVGADPNDDFTIKPNCQYKNNITVTGITVNNRQEGIEALLDTRVDVKNDPVFIEMLRERMFDAHFNVTPMDIYIFDQKVAQSVEVTILNEDGEPAGVNEMTWIRMEPYYHAPAGKCDYKEEQYAATRAGDGKRKYFTEGLMNELNQYSYNRSYTVTKPEERIYFYVDENVPTDTQARRGEDVKARTAQVRITYKSTDGDEYSQIATFEQAGMRAVYFDKYSNGNTWADRYNRIYRNAYYFYIEEHEEYLAHYDGKNEYTDTYEGMVWGLSGVETGLGVKDGFDFWQYMSWGWYNTNEIMEQCRNHDSWTNVEGRENEEMTLNTKPSGAAEYCYNKNMRNEEGHVVNVEWYLPTISELEYAIDKYYGIYKVFQNKWYWSSNPGAIGDPNNDYTGNAGEDKNRARATKSVLSGREYDHAVSAANEKYEDGTGGSAYRSNKFRVRAAYIPESAKPDDVNPDYNWSRR